MGKGSLEDDAEWRLLINAEALDTESGESSHKGSLRKMRRINAKKKWSIM